MSRPTDLLSFTHQAAASSSFASASTTRSPLPPPPTSVVLTDTLSAPGTFALAQLIQRALKTPSAVVAGKGKAREGGESEGEMRRANVVVVGVSEREEFWGALLKKQGIQLPLESTAGRFAFVDASDPSIPLTALYTSLVALLAPPSSSAAAEQGGEPGPLVVIDDLSAVVWRGEEVRAVVRWWKAVRAAVAATNSSLLTLLHADSLSPSYPPEPSLSLSSSSTPFESPEDQYLFRSVLQQSEVWVEVSALVTGGGAGGIRGEITVYRGPALVEHAASPSTGGGGGFSLDPGPPLQYKLEDGGPVYEVKGLGRFL
ncbi:hypothetical protein JCM8097_004817 [Rhodosporidiobolus ruineniae]